MMVHEQLKARMDPGSLSKQNERFPKPRTRSLNTQPTRDHRFTACSCTTLLMVAAASDSARTRTRTRSPLADVVSQSQAQCTIDAAELGALKPTGRRPLNFWFWLVVSRGTTASPFTTLLSLSASAATRWYHCEETRTSGANLRRSAATSKKPRPSRAEPRTDCRPRAVLQPRRNVLQNPHCTMTSRERERFHRLAHSPSRCPRAIHCGADPTWLTQTSSTRMLRECAHGQPTPKHGSDGLSGR